MFRAFIVFAGALGLASFASSANAGEAKGKPAICQTIGEPKEHCTFIARNGDGSFDIITANERVSFDKVGQDTMNVTWTLPDGRLGATRDLGVYTRSQANRACWIQKDMSGKTSGWCIW